MKRDISDFLAIIFQLSKLFSDTRLELMEHKNYCTCQVFKVFSIHRDYYSVSSQRVNMPLKRFEAILKFGIIWTLTEQNYLILDILFQFE